MSQSKLGYRLRQNNPFLLWYSDQIDSHVFQIIFENRFAHLR